MINFRSKLPRAQASIFPVMTALANEHQAVNLAQGFPDFPTDARLIELVNMYMQKGMNQYAPPAGVLSLRERISELTAMQGGRLYHPESEVTLTAGGTQAIRAVIEAFVHPGDEVIVFEPAYDCYAPSITVNGGVVIGLELMHPSFRIDWAALRSLVSSKTRMIVLNTPHNPTGSVISEEDIKELLAIVEHTDIIILSDEVYEHIIFDGYPHHSMSKYPELAERSLIVSSFGKTFHSTGWRLGYLLGPSYLMAEVRKLQQFAIYSCNTPIQYALADYIAESDSWMTVKAMLQEKRDYFAEAMRGTRFNLLNCAGTYFQSARYGDLSEEGDFDFAVRLTKEHGVATVPLSPFYSDCADRKTIRFCFAKTKETLDRALDRLIKL